jgi:uncharacterized protein with HEPN domain
MRNPTERLRDILDAIANIERYSVRGRGAFEQDELVRTWILYHLQIIGEAAAQLGRVFHAAHPEVPWAQIVAKCISTRLLRSRPQRGLEP